MMAVKSNYLRLTSKLLALSESDNYEDAISVMGMTMNDILNEIYEMGDRI